MVLVIIHEYKNNWCVITSKYHKYKRWNRKLQLQLDRTMYHVTPCEIRFYVSISVCSWSFINYDCYHLVRVGDFSQPLKLLEHECIKLINRVFMLWREKLIWGKTSPLYDDSVQSLLSPFQRSPIPWNWKFAWIFRAGATYSACAGLMSRLRRVCLQSQLISCGSSSWACNYGQARVYRQRVKLILSSQIY